MADKTRRDVDPAPRGVAHDDAHGPRRIGLRPRDARYGRERGGARGQMQKFAAGKFHFAPPSHHSITSSARASRASGTATPSVRAVWRLMTSSNFVDCITGRSAGFTPLRMRPV